MMNWKLVLQLSGFGLAMGVATVFWIPSSAEPFCWLAIFGICAFVLAKRAGGAPFRLMMALTGPAIGVASGVVLGVFAVVATKATARPAPPAPPARAAQR